MPYAPFWYGSHLGTFVVLRLLFFFFSCHPDIDVVYQDPLLYHPVWGSYESVLRCWFFDRRDELINQ